MVSHSFSRDIERAYEQKALATEGKAVTTVHVPRGIFFHKSVTVLCSVGCCISGAISASGARTNVRSCIAG